MLVCAVLTLGALLALGVFSLSEGTRRTDALAESGRRALPIAAAVMQAEPITPLPGAAYLDPRKVALGERLFHDASLSGDGSISCASCHSLAKGGADGIPRSKGVAGRAGKINAPTVFNSSLNFRQFWDGRAASLEEQVAGPIHNPDEMGSDWKHVLQVVSRDASYSRAFDELYAEKGIRAESVQDAIVAFERSLTTPDSRLDRYLRGERDALSAEELQGYRLFKQYGCIACHQGANVGGNMYQKLGVMADYFADRGNVTEADLGRYRVTGREEDRHVFKVPGLRNVELTAPYLHDGSAPTMEGAIYIMGRYQLGVTIPPTDIARIATFLRTLTGEYRGTRP